MGETSVSFQSEKLLDLQSKITSLQEMLQQQSPGYENILRVIHENLNQDDSTVHLLTEEQIGVIVAGLSKKKGIVIAEVESKQRKAKLKDITIDEL